MIWVFVILTLAGIGITVRIFLEYKHDSSGIRTDLERIQYNILDAKNKIEATKLAREQAAQRVEELDQALNQLQTTANELHTKISEHREAQASRGKYRVSR